MIDTTVSRRPNPSPNDFLQPPTKMTVNYAMMTIRLARTILVLLGPAIAAAIEVTPELIVDLKVVEEVRLSGDGQWVSYIVSPESVGEKGKAMEFATINSHWTMI